MTKEFEYANNALTTLLTVMKFHAEGKYCDVVLRVGCKLFKCQRSLLAANSEYFDTMFSSTFKESRTPSDEPITLHELDAMAFEEILHFIYTGNIRISDSNVHQLLLMNDFLRLCTAYVKEECVNYVENRSEKPEPMSNAFDLLSFAHMKAEKILVDILTAHMGKHLHYYSEDAKLMEIPVECLEELLKFTKDHFLNLPGSHNVLIMIIHNWINYDRQQRRKHRCDLMKNVNFSNVSPDVISEVLNCLENFADEVTGLPKSTRSLRKLQKMKVEKVHHLSANRARTEATITLIVKPSEIKMDDIILSSPQMVSNFEWRICIKRFDDNLSIYLRCYDTSMIPRWNCYAKCTFTLSSKKEEKCHGYNRTTHYIFSRQLDHIYDSRGFHRFLKWNYLTDPENGYINDDGSINLQASVYADVAFSQDKYL